MVLCCCFELLMLMFCAKSVAILAHGFVLKSVAIVVEICVVIWIALLLGFLFVFFFTEFCFSICFVCVRI